MLLLLAGCGGSDPETATPNSSSRVEKCVERFADRAEGGATQEVERYVRTAYCEPFEKRGWVHDDGTLTINAYVDNTTVSCASAGQGEPSSTVPCERLEDQDDPPVLDCGLLHLVRRSEVREYFASQRRKRGLRCDDGTPVTDLGAR